MENCINPIPLSLYVHIPWCVRKCPYCDFNSHELKGSLPETLYVNALLQELDSYLPYVQKRELTSIFFGGGTPSIFSAQAIGQIVEGITQRISLASHIEMTMEANPGTIDQVRFSDFKQAGINRLSLGIQSLQDEKLKSLGRIHNGADAQQAIRIAKDAGFSNFNLDLMYGLPNQTIADVIFDIETALTFEPTHFSWYQLTIEPNTFFYHQTPVLPSDETIWEMQVAGQQMINQAGYNQYEVSAYAKPGKHCLHNRNYWEFGDYLGIGAGAHSKITDAKNRKIVRFSQVKNPRDYLDPLKRQVLNAKTLTDKDLIFEFMLNALRLTEGVPSALFTERTGIPWQQIEMIVDKATKKGLLAANTSTICPTELGKRFLNDLVGMFLSAYLKV